MQDVIYTGSCLCGSIKYTTNSEIMAVSHCHCSMCRKAHGAAFATYGSAPQPAHNFTAGYPSRVPRWTLLLSPASKNISVLIQRPAGLRFMMTFHRSENLLRQRKQRFGYFNPNVKTAIPPLT